MRISILCSDVNHPVHPHLKSWADRYAQTHTVELVQRVAQLSGGDILFLVSCSEIVGREARTKYKYSLVLHASDLPKGRGWSPVIWQVLEGQSKFTVTMLEAADQVDSGNIWAKVSFELSGHELAYEINDKLFVAELQLMDYAVSNIDCVKPTSQDAAGVTYYRKRTPEDSRLDPKRTLAEQFDLMRIADPERYPVFFDFRGCRYVVRLEKATPEGDLK